MKSYFKRLALSSESVCIDPDQMSGYRASLIEEMKKQGASESEIKLISDSIIINSINHGRNPKAVAWAILQ